VVGASPDERSTGQRIIRFLDRYGYAGAVYAVNPKYAEILGKPCVATVAQAGPVDLALIVVPATAVPAVLEDCVRAGAKHAIIMAAGFADDSQASGHELQQAVARIVAASTLRVGGPNAEGYLNVLDGIPASFSSSVDPEVGFVGIDWVPEGSNLVRLAAGNIAVLAQSGGLGFSCFSRGLADGLGFSHIVSTGNEVDLDILECLAYLLEDPRVRVLSLYLEGLKQPERFTAVARRAAELGKPLVIGKAGASESGRKAALSHTGHLAGTDAVYEAVFKSYGIHRVRDQEELIDASWAFSCCPLPRGNRVAVISWSGGSAVWTADACERAGFVLPEIDPDRQRELRALLPSFASTANPVDITGASQIGLADVLRVLVDAPYLDAIVLISTLHRSELLRRDFSLMQQIVASADKPIILHTYTRPSAESKRLMRELGLPFYTSSTRTVRALRALADYASFQQRWQASAGRTAVAVSDSPELTRNLSEYDASALLAQAGLPTSKQILARSPREAAAAARRLGLPVALKLQSPDLAHKSAVGGVLLNVRTLREVRAGCARLLELATTLGGGLQVQGVLVQEMVTAGVEVIVGIENSSGFGPLVLLGMGGLRAEELRDSTMRCAPITMAEARLMLGELRGAPFLLQHRPDGMEPDVDALLQLLVDLSEWAARNAHLVRELDLNPVIVHARGRGVAIVDSLMVVAADGVAGAGES
jgi:acyl-CoA synthetase (NDP forming)